MARNTSKKTAPATKSAAKANPDTIVSTGIAKGGDKFHTRSAGGKTLFYARERAVPALQKLDVVGGSFAAVEKWLEEHPATVKPAGQLARGLDGRSAPHSAKAVSDNRARESKPAAAKATKKAERKAARAERAAPKADDARRIKLVNKKFTYGGEGTARRASWNAAAKAGTVADYLKAGGKAKYLPRFVSAGAIQLVG